MTTEAKETDLAEKVVQWLRGDEWEVYQEVLCGGPVADIVAVKGRISWIVEVKTRFSLDLVAQADDWVRSGSARFVSIACPGPSDPHSRRAGLIQRFLQERKIGMLHVGRFCRQVIAPSFIRRGKRNRRDIREHLYADQKSSIAGSTSGGHWTPWKRTCQAAREHISANPGCTIKEVVTALDHHYATDRSARVCLLSQIRDGTFDGIETKRDGRKLTLFVSKSSD